LTKCFSHVELPEFRPGYEIDNLTGLYETDNDYAIKYVWELVLYPTPVK